MTDPPGEVPPPETVAVRVTLWPNAAGLGETDTVVVVAVLLDCGLETTKDCCTWAAAVKLVFPAWLASITHVPAEGNETTPPDSEQPDEDASREITTGLPDPPPVAAGV